MGNTKLFAGIDIGASTTKAVVIDAEKEILGYEVQRSGVDFNESAHNIFSRVLEKIRKTREDIYVLFSTGYGRNNVEFSQETRTEIACHAKAAYFYRPTKIIVVDIGGQDSKVIYLDEAGKRTNFKMNRKCAAGTGAFLEEISLQLNVPLEKMNELALKAQGKVTLGSFCTVFTKTEILALIRKGEKLEEIVKGVYDSVAKRILEMAPLEGEVVMTGGVIAYNSVVGKILEEKTGATIFIPPFPQIAGALGAALFALEAGQSSSN